MKPLPSQVESDSELTIQDMLHAKKVLKRAAAMGKKKADQETEKDVANTATGLYGEDVMDIVNKVNEVTDGNKSNEDEGGETGKKGECIEEGIVSCGKEKEGDTVQPPEAGHDRKEEGIVTSGKQKEGDSV